MLVLTRRLNQSVMIGDDVLVTILDIHGDQVRIGIDAPRSITVHREEVYRDLEAANRNAASSTRDTDADAVLRDLKPPAKE